VRVEGRHTKALREWEGSSPLLVVLADPIRPFGLPPCQRLGRLAAGQSARTLDGYFGEKHSTYSQVLPDVGLRKEAVDACRAEGEPC
jgi:hypothetical protein